MFGFRFSIAPLLALLVFAASAAIVWLAHIEAGEMASARQPPLVKASTKPLKMLPEDPGGRAVADLGGVGDLLREQPTSSEERLLPRPEQPVTPADTAGADGQNEANAALEALVSELRTARSRSDGAGVGGPNPDESVNFPSPTRPPEPVTPSTVSPTTQPADGETAVATLSETFEATVGGRFRVQLAAVREEDDAQRAWSLFREQLGPFMTGLQPFFERAETSNGVFYRVQVGPFGETAEADRLCAELKKQDVSCFVVSR